MKTANTAQSPQSRTYPLIGPAGVMFHHFHGQGHPAGQGSISSEQFEAMLKFVGLDRFVTAKEFLARATEGRLNGSELCLTFDDNLLCQYDIALPVLRRHQLTAFWFIYSGSPEGPAGRLEIYRYFRTVAFPDVEDFYAAFFMTLQAEKLGAEIDHALSQIEIEHYLGEFAFYTTNDRKFRYIRDKILGPERYEGIMEAMINSHNFDKTAASKKLWMKEPQWRELVQQDHVVGLHSDTHPTDLAALSPEEQQKEYCQNAEFLKKTLGVTPISVSHPCNSYTQGTLEILKSLGIRLGFRANLLQIPPKSLMELPREDHTNILKAMGDS